MVIDNLTDKEFIISHNKPLEEGYSRVVNLGTY